jgi:hypothetical protein
LTEIGHDYGPANDGVMSLRLPLPIGLRAVWLQFWPQLLKTDC